MACLLKGLIGAFARFTRRGEKGVFTLPVLATTD
jgi:hypothetical protein